MQKTILFTALIGSMLATAALADNDFRCGNEPLDRWMGIKQIAEHAAKLGIDVRSVEIDDGCYEVSGRSNDGQRVEVRMHPVTAAQISVDSD